MRRVTDIAEEDSWDQPRQMALSILPWLVGAGALVCHYHWPCHGTSLSSVLNGKHGGQSVDASSALNKSRGDRALSRRVCLCSASHSTLDAWPAAVQPGWVLVRTSQPHKRASRVGPRRHSMPHRRLHFAAWRRGGRRRQLQAEPPNPRRRRRRRRRRRSRVSFSKFSPPRRPARSCGPWPAHPAGTCEGSVCACVRVCVCVWWCVPLRFVCACGPLVPRG